VVAVKIQERVVGERRYNLSSFAMKKERGVVLRFMGGCFVVVHGGS